MFPRFRMYCTLRRCFLWEKKLDQFLFNSSTNVQALSNGHFATFEKNKMVQVKVDDVKRNTISEEEFLVKLQNDPDKFGLSEQETMDEGDIAEEEMFKNIALKSQKLPGKKYADIIKKLIEQRKIKEAIDILETRMLKEDQVKPEYYIYTMLIGACGRVGYAKKAFSLYNDMKKRGLKVTRGTYSALFNACANTPFLEDGLAKAKYLRNTMIEKMYESNDVIYNSMIKAFGRCGDLSTAFGVVDEMIDKKFRINNDTINFLLQACITDKESGFRHALLVWRKMIKLKIKPTLFTYNLMLRSIRDCNLGDIEATNDVLSRILPEKQIAIDRDSNLVMLEGSDEKLVLAGDQNSSNSNTPTITHMNPNLIATVPHLGNLISLSEVMKPEEKLLLVGGMRGFLDHMKENSCIPNIKTFTLLLDSIPNTSIAEKELLSLMKKEVRFDIDFFNMVIKRRGMRFDYQGGHDVFKMMAKFNMRPNLITYGVLALGCKTKNEAFQLIEEMKELHYRLNAEILGTMLKQACHHKNFSYILDIMELCITEKVQPNKMFIEHLNNFKTVCRRMIKNKDDELGQSKVFQSGFQIFRMQYKKWLSEVEIDNSEDTHPWQQFNQGTDSKTDKYYRDKADDSKFKSKFKGPYNNMKIVNLKEKKSLTVT